MATVLDKIRIRILDEGFKKMELVSIDKNSNKESYIHLALKTIFLIHKKRQEYKSDAFTNLIWHRELQNQRSYIFDKIIRRQEWKNVTAAFHRIHNEALEAKVNSQLITTGIKSLKLTVESLEKIVRDHKYFALRSILLFARKKSFNEVKLRLDEELDNERASRMEYEQKTHTSANHRNIIDFIDVLDKQFLRRKGMVFRQIDQYLDERFQRLKKGSAAFATKYWRTFVFKRLFYAFSTINFAVQKKKQSSQKLRIEAASTIFSKMKEITKGHQKNGLKVLKSYNNIRKVWENGVALKAKGFETRMYFKRWLSKYQRHAYMR
mmetsp:Transcript_41468/g.36843  ORF Transcript_41468/g.36843 Transcript_41468/m.36843 type:complete len:322 (-) Transcript_41468:606-1571(-)